MHDWDCVVIGAGVSGLMAARLLTLAGKRALVLEARDRIGGRIDTRRDHGATPIEAGAEFVHGEAPILDELGPASGLTTALLDGESFLKRGDRFVPNGEDIQKVQELLSSYRGEELTAARLIERWVSEGKLEESQRISAWRYIEGFNAADLKRASALALAEQERAAAQIKGENAYHVLHGYDALPRYLASSLTLDALRLRTVVTRVSWKRGEVRIESQTPRGSALPELTARACIVTVPIGVLHSGDLAFAPELPERTRAAMKQLAAGPVVKVVLRLRPELAHMKLPGTNPETELAQVGFLHGEELAFPTWWPLRPLRAQVLTGWAAGPVAEALAGLDDDAILARAMESLAKLLSMKPEEVDAGISGAFVTHWQRDRFARGAYSYVLEGGSEAPQLASEPIEDTLFFAGEALNTSGHNATVHGALESGERAAEALLGILNP